MKKLSITLLFISLFLQGTGQSCLPEGISFSTQAQINNFQNNYPGCSVIEGDVHICGDDITNLDSLKYITTINGGLTIGNGWIGGNPNLIDLKGLNNLFHIGGRLWIYYSSALTSLNGLQGLHTVGGNITMCNNDELSSIAQLTGLVSVGSNLRIFGNMSLNSLAGLEKISSVNGDIWFATILDTAMTGLEGLTYVSGEFQISGNVNMTSFHGLEALTEVGGELWIHTNAALQNLSGLDNLAKTGGGLTLEDNDALIDLQGLEHLTQVGGQLSIYDNDNLISFTGIGNLFEAGSMYIASNPLIMNLTGMDNLSAIGEHLEIVENSSLINLSGLESLGSVAGGIWISHNPSLVSLTGIENLNGNSIHNLTIKLNQSLSTCAVESICEFLSNPSGFVEIYDNDENCNNPPEIAHQCGFTMPCLPYGNYNFFFQSDIDSFQVNYPDCHKLEGEVVIRGEDITGLNGLSNVDSIGFRINIYGNSLLQNLNGLDSMNYIGGALIISGNDILTDISSLGHFNTDSLVVLEIENNPVLSVCNFESICHFIENPGPGSDINIYDNAEGCATLDEVAAVCGVYISENEQDIVLKISPNPTSSEVNFEILYKRNQALFIDVYTVHGQKVATLSDNNAGNILHHLVWNTSTVPPGIYFYRISTIDHRPSKIGKIIVCR